MKHLFFLQMMIDIIGLRLKEVGGFYQNAFADMNFSFTTNVSAEHIAANLF